MIKTGGWGGFLASVRDIGVTGQQQQASTVSPEEATLGGAGGLILSAGGGTNPGSLLPSPARSVPVQKVAAREAVAKILGIRELVFIENNGW